MMIARATLARSTAMREATPTEVTATLAIATAFIDAAISVIVAAAEAVALVGVCLGAGMSVVSRGCAARRSFSCFVSRLIDVFVSVAARALDTAIGAAQARGIA